MFFAETVSERAVHAIVFPASPPAGFFVAVLGNGSRFESWRRERCLNFYQTSRIQYSSLKVVNKNVSNIGE